MIEIYKVTNDLVAALKTVLSDVFPMLAPQGTELPFVTYQHTGIAPDGTKDGEASITVTYSINIVTVDYSSGLQYLDAIRGALNRMSSSNYQYEYELVGASEQAYDDGYTQTLTVGITAYR